MPYCLFTNNISIFEGNYPKHGGPENGLLERKTWKGV